MLNLGIRNNFILIEFVSFMLLTDVYQPFSHYVIENILYIQSFFY